MLKLSKCNKKVDSSFFVTCLSQTLAVVVHSPFMISHRLLCNRNGTPTTDDVPGLFGLRANAAETLLHFASQIVHDASGYELASVTSQIMFYHPSTIVFPISQM